MGVNITTLAKMLPKGEKKEEAVVVGLEQMQLESPDRAVKSIGELMSCPVSILVSL